MPVKKLVRNFRVPTGYAVLPGSALAGFTGTLERDLVFLKQFEPGFLSFEEQPLTLPYIRADGSSGRYTPDALVQYRGAALRKPELIEVKESKTLRAEWNDLKPKFKAAVKYCHERGWLFRIYTEKRIRTPRLKNLAELLRFREPPTNELDCVKWIRAVRDLPSPTMRSVQDEVAKTPRDRAFLNYALRHCIAVGRIQADLDQPLTEKSALWLPEGR